MLFKKAKIKNFIKFVRIRTFEHCNEVCIYYGLICDREKEIRETCQKILNGHKFAYIPNQKLYK